MVLGGGEEGRGGAQAAVVVGVVAGRGAAEEGVRGDLEALHVGVVEQPHGQPPAALEGVARHHGGVRVVWRVSARTYKQPT